MTIENVIRRDNFIISKLITYFLDKVYNTYIIYHNIHIPKTLFYALLEIHLCEMAMKLENS